jgi:hypothetical protein
MGPRTAGIGGLLLLVCLIEGTLLGQGKTYTGEIMDSNCAKDGSHAMMLKKEGMANMDPNDAKAKKMCTDNCVQKMGAKYVLYTPSKAVYQLDDQTKPAQFAGQKVSITGTLDAATKTIHVTGIKAAS